MKVKRLNHAVLRVSDVPRAQEFWTSALGMVEAG
ncbi:MAG: VOC family protein [Actinomycetia bacterium]|nr:VOC family protein [Actinomycetes bacterium]